MARNRELVAAGYHAQVHVEEQTSFVFLLENGQAPRAAPRRDEAFAQMAASFQAQSLSRASRLAFAQRAAAAGRTGLHAADRRATSWGPRKRLPGAIGGSSIARFWAACRWRCRAPASPFSISHSEKLTAALRPGAARFFHGERTCCGSASPHGWCRRACAGAGRNGEGGRQRARAAARRPGGFDPTLAARSIAASARSAYQLAQIEGKAGREAMRRSERAARGSSVYSTACIFPSATCRSVSTPSCRSWRSTGSIWSTI